MIKKILLPVFFLFMLVTLTNAQSISVGPQVGYFKSQDAEKGSFLLGAAARLKLSSVLGAELSINYKKEDLEGGYKVTSYPIMLSGMLYVLPIAYVSAGVGWYNTKIEYLTFSNTSQEFGYHIGIGAELGLGNITLAGDIKYVFLNYDFSVNNLPSVDIKNNNIVISAALLFNL